MKFPIIILLLFCTFFLPLTSCNYEEEENEISIINAVIDSLYKIDYCPEIHINEIESIGDLERNIFTKKKKEFYNILDTIRKVTLVSDTLKAIDVTKIRWLLGRGAYYDEFENHTAEKRYFDIDSLHQYNIDFESDANNLPEKITHSKIYKEFYLSGSLSFSRVLINKSKDKAVLYYEFEGGSKCGYGRYVFLMKENNMWRIKESKEVWVS